MKKATMAQIARDKDFEQAKERYEACTSNRWKSEWWKIITDIWATTTKWAKEYIIDPIKKEIISITKGKRHNYCYWIRLLDAEGNMVFNKIGTSRDPIKRWAQIMREKYCRWNKITQFEVVRVWDCGDEAAEGLESYLRALSIKTYGSKCYVPNDRFTCELETKNINRWVKRYLGVLA